MLEAAEVQVKLIIPMVAEAAEPEAVVLAEVLQELLDKPIQVEAAEAPAQQVVVQVEEDQALLLFED
jgi:hypothetical protein